MGFSLSASAAIIGISILVAAEITIGTFFPAINDIYSSYDDMRNRAIEQIQSDIKITKISAITNNSNYDLNITVNNTGSTTLDTTNFNVLINGTNQVFYKSKRYLYPETHVYLKLYSLPGTGNKRLKVITNNGISDYQKYTVS
ncbi:MAG: hypothetical protein V5A68_01455 [Candidatus Thermoplasmatota archaeon]